MPKLTLNENSVFERAVSILLARAGVPERFVSDWKMESSADSAVLLTAQVRLAVSNEEFQVLLEEVANEQ